MLKRNRQNKKILSGRISSILAVTVTALIFSMGMAGRTHAAVTIYIAGTPDEWPFEYYDKDEKTYRGIIPDILSEAAGDAGIVIEYQQPSLQDNRLFLAGNLQVDAISSVGLADEEIEKAGLKKGPELLSYREGDAIKTIFLSYTKSMSDIDLKSLEQAVRNLDAVQIQTICIKYAQNGDMGNLYSKELKIVFVVFIISLLLLMLFFAFRQYGKKHVTRVVHTDSMTGKDSLNAWKKKYEEIVSDDNRYHYAVLNLYCGIDQITHIYGYAEAENALKLISDICEPFLDREKEAFARFNEFYFVFFIQYTGVDGIKNRVNQIHEKLTAVFAEEKRYFLDLHTGIYRLTYESRDVLMTLQYSELAMEHAKNNFLPIAIYDEFVERETVSGYAMEHEAIHGLMQHEFIMYLQPIVDLKSGKICGAESLVRWQNPLRGLLKPGDFLHVLKKKKLTGEMNMEIFKQGCRFLSEENELGNRLILLFNFTVENIGNDQFVDHLATIADDSNVDPSQITIQLNQAVEISRSSIFMDTIKKLRSHGFGVCLAGLELDNVFFEYLDCGINKMKLKPELIRRLDKEEGRRVVTSLIKLCHELSLEILSVGVENEEQERFLKDHGCENATGFYFHYPVSQGEFNNLLVKQD